MGEKAQLSHIRAIKDFAAFLRHSPDMATPEELRVYQLHMTDAGISPSTFTRILALRFFFGTTCGREEMKRFMKFRTEPRRLPVVFSVEEVAEILLAAPGPGLKYRAALSIAYGAGLRAAEVCNLRISDIDSDRMLIHVAQGKGRKDRSHAVAQPAGPVALLLARGTTPRLAVSGPAQNQSDLTATPEPRFCRRKDPGRGVESRHLAHSGPQLRDASAGGGHRCPRDPGAAGHAKLSTTAQYTHVATKTIPNTASRFEALSKLQDHSEPESLPLPLAGMVRSNWSWLTSSVPVPVPVARRGGKPMRGMSQPLHPPCRHLQLSPDQRLRGHGCIPLGGLPHQIRRPTKGHAAGNARIHPPLPDPRPARWLVSHPALRPARQCRSEGQYRKNPGSARGGATRDGTAG